MKQAFAEHFFLFVLITIVHQVATSNNEVNQRDSPQQRTFKAAVYEHAVILPTYRQTAVPRGVALENMMKNLLIYQQQAERAAAEVRNFTKPFLVLSEKGFIRKIFCKGSQITKLEVVIPLAAACQ